MEFCERPYSPEDPPDDLDSYWKAVGPQHLYVYPKIGDGVRAMEHIASIHKQYRRLAREVRMRAWQRKTVQDLEESKKGCWSPNTAQMARHAVSSQKYWALHTELSAFFDS